MGELKLSELQAEVRANLGGRADLDSRLTRLLNLAQTRIARRRDFEEMQRGPTSLTLTYTGVPVDDKTKTLAQNTREVYAIVLLDGVQSHRLKRRTQQWFNTHVPAPDVLATRAPLIYALWGSNITTWPVVDKQYDAELWWSAWPTPFSDSNPNQLSDLKEKDDLLIALATHNAFQSLGKRDDAQQWFAIYSSMMRDALLEDAESPDLNLGGDPDIDRITGNYWQDPFVREAP